MTLANMSNPDAMTGASVNGRDGSTLGKLSPTEDEELYGHYGMSSSGGTPTSADDAQRASGDSRRDRAGEPDVRGQDTSGPTTDDAMTRSEERLQVGTEEREAGRVGLRKHIVTENVTTTIPVSHEEVTLEREPITEANRGDALAGEELELGRRVPACA